MRENNEKNGIKNGTEEVKNGKKMLPERNEKGQFVNSPGPGRGRKGENQFELDGELLDMIEEVVKTGLNAEELKDRLKAAGIGIRVQSMKKQDDTGPVIEPEVLEWLRLIPNLISAYKNKTGVSISHLDLMKRMGEVCLNCDRLGTEEEDNPFKEVE